MTTNANCCANCAFWSKLSEERAKNHQMDEGCGTPGACRRFPPTRLLTFVQGGPVERVDFPATGSKEWCGEHELCFEEKQRRVEEITKKGLVYDGNT